MAAINQFRKSERLNNYKLKKDLFKNGNYFKKYPLKICWLVIEKEKFVYKTSPVLKASIPRCKKNRELKKTYYDITGNTLPQSAVFIFPAKVIFSLSGKTFKKATERNYIKRLIKEAYRKNKTFFYSFLKEKGLYCLIAFNYIGTHKPVQSEIEEALFLSLQFLIKKIESKTRDKNDICLR